MLQRIHSNKGVTLIEILLVVSLISLLSLALYQALSGGLNIWKRTQDLVIEEDIMIFFEKLSGDLRNAYSFSSFKFEGDQYRFTFPTMVYTAVDERRTDEAEQFEDQLGRVEYYYDPIKDGIFRREAVYGQAVLDQYKKERLMVRSVDRLDIHYIYITKDGEMVSEEVLGRIPSSIEVQVVFSDQKGQRTMRKIMDVPIGS